MGAKSWRVDLDRNASPYLARADSSAALPPPRPPPPPPPPPLESPPPVIIAPLLMPPRAVFCCVAVKSKLIKLSSFSSNINFFVVIFIYCPLQMRFR